MDPPPTKRRRLLAVTQGERACGVGGATGVARDVVPAAARRFVFHIDLDCFFAQVERELNPALMGQPLCVRQHSDIICVSYEARALGVQKHMLPSEVRSKFPRVRIVHTYTINDKVSYKYYREASKRFFQCLRRHPAVAVVQKGSMDEAWLDVTPHLQAEASRRRTAECESSLCELADALASRLRSDIKRTCGFVASVGIGSNRVQAKLASRMGKPNGQFQITPTNLDSVLAKTPFEHLPGCNGQARHYFRSCGIKTAADLQTLRLPLLKERYGDNFHDVCRGMDDGEVRETGPPKSLQTQMALTASPKWVQRRRMFRPVAPWLLGAITPHLRTLAQDLADRVASDTEEFSRHPTSLCLTTQLGWGKVCGRGPMEHIDGADVYFTSVSRTKLYRAKHPLLSLTKHVTPEMDMTDEGSVSESATFPAMHGQKAALPPAPGPHGPTFVAGGGATGSAGAGAGAGSGAGAAGSAPGPTTASGPSEADIDRIAAAAKRLYKRVARKAVERAGWRWNGVFCKGGTSVVDVGRRQADRGTGHQSGSATSGAVAGVRTSSRGGSLNTWSPLSVICLNLTATRFQPGNVFKVSKLRFPVLESVHGSSSSEEPTAKPASDGGGGSSSGAASGSVGDHVICERCGERVSAFELPEHMDHHVALDVQEALNAEERSLRDHGGKLATGRAAPAVAAASVPRPAGGGRGKARKVSDSPPRLSALLPTLVDPGDIRAFLARTRNAAPEM